MKIREHSLEFVFLLQNLMLIDEADEAMPGQEKPRRKHLSSQSSTSSLDSPPPSPGLKKRKPGARFLRLNFISMIKQRSKKRGKLHSVNWTGKTAFLSQVRSQTPLLTVVFWCSLCEKCVCVPGPLPRGLPYRKLLTPPPEESDDTPPISPVPVEIPTSPPAKKHKPLPLPEGRPVCVPTTVIREKCILNVPCQKESFDCFCRKGE